MKIVKKTAEYTIFLRNDKRYAIRSADRRWINGEDKIAILQKEDLLKVPEPRTEEPSPVAETGEGAATVQESGE